MYYDDVLRSLSELGAAVDVNGGENELPTAIGATSVFSRDGRQIAVTCKRQHVDAAGTPRHYLYTLAVDGVSVDGKNEKCTRDEYTSPAVKDLLGWRKYATGKGGCAVNTGAGIRVDMTDDEIREYVTREMTDASAKYLERIVTAAETLQKRVRRVVGDDNYTLNISAMLDDKYHVTPAFIDTICGMVAQRIARAKANSAAAKEAKRLEAVDVSKLDEGAQDAMMMRLLMARGMTEEQAREAVAALAAPATTDDTTTD